MGTKATGETTTSSRLPAWPSDVGSPQDGAEQPVRLFLPESQVECWGQEHFCLLYLCVFLTHLGWGVGRVAGWGGSVNTSS